MDPVVITIVFPQALLLAYLAPPAHSSPLLVPLQSQLPAEPIEDPVDWAWGQHPDEGLGYKAKDSLAVDVCLANPALVNTAKCVLPLDVCLANPQHLSSLGCSGNELPDLPLDVCLAYPELVTRRACSGHNLPLAVCLEYPELLTRPACSGHDLPLEACLANPHLLTKPSCAGNKYSLAVCLDSCSHSQLVRTTSPGVLVHRTMKSRFYPLVQVLLKDTNLLSLNAWIIRKLFAH